MSLVYVPYTFRFLQSHNYHEYIITTSVTIAITSIINIMINTTISIITTMHNHQYYHSILLLL